MSDSLLLFESLQKKSGPRAKVQQPGTSDQSTRKRTASIKCFFRPPRAFGAPFESFTALLLECFSDSEPVLILRVSRGKVRDLIYLSSLRVSDCLHGSFHGSAVVTQSSEEQRLLSRGKITTTERS